MNKETNNKIHKNQHEHSSCNACSLTESILDFADEPQHEHNHSHSHEHNHDHLELNFDTHDDDNNKIINILKENPNLLISFAFFIIGFLINNQLYSLVTFLIAYIIISKNILINAVKSVTKGHMLDENFLMAIASIVAFLIGQYAEGVAVMLFYSIGELAEDYAINNSKKSISSLLDLRPEFANVKHENEIIKVSPSDVKIGDIMVVKAGERIPLDGIVINGESNIDSSMLTGESLPVQVSKGSEVFSGTINKQAVIEVKVTRSFKNSAVSKILNMVSKANQNKAKTEKFITKFAKIYTPIVVTGAILISILPPIIAGAELMTWVYKGAIFLVVSCPCALVISVPLGYFGGIGGAAKNGILVKGGQYLDILTSTKTIIFDKTGTLTKADFKVSNIKSFGDINEQQILKISATLESFSTHPIALAVVSEYNEKIDTALAKDIKEISGKGISGIYDNLKILLGNKTLMNDNNIQIPNIDIENDIATTLYLACDNKIIGIISLSDHIKDGTTKALNELKTLGIQNFIMLTGDKKQIAGAISKKLGIKQTYSELLPEDKLSILEKIMSKNKDVVYVGDGINDAPVLTRADVGISMGNLGSDVAVESSDIVLMTDDIKSVADSIKIARFTKKIIIQNITMALSIKILIMILGVFGYATLWIAIFGDVGVALMAILNSSRTLKIKTT